MINVALAEDDSLERDLLIKEIITNPAYNLIITAVDGFDLLQQIHKAKILPDILLLDINMPKVDGLLVTSYLHLIYPEIRIIGVSSHCSENLIRAVLSEGANGFITKYFLYKQSILFMDHYRQTDFLGEAIHNVFNGNNYIDKLLTNHPAQIKLSISTHQVITSHFKQLKQELVQFALLNAAELTFAEIAAIMNLSKASIKNYYNQLSVRFNLGNRKELTTFCIKNGLVKLPFYLDNNLASFQVTDA